MKQWHPIFVRLLRPLLEPHFEVQTNVPVGDMPREADIVLLRRAASGSLPFLGLWSYLTTWNVLEFKGRTVSPRLRDLDALVEIGLGIDRRLNEERERGNQRMLGPQQVSFWYVVNHLGKRFRRGAGCHLGGLDALGPGIWRWSILQRMVFLVSSAELAIEKDSVPLHLVSQEPQETALAVGRLLAERPELWKQYASWFSYLQEDSWEEVQDMAKTTYKRSKVSWQPLLDAMRDDKKLEKYVYKALLKEANVDKILSSLSAAQLEEIRRRFQS